MELLKDTLVIGYSFFVNFLKKLAYSLTEINILE